MRRAHLRCFAGLVEEVAPRIDGGREGPMGLERERDRLDAETPNLRVALEFAREGGDRPSTRSTHWLTRTASAGIRKDNHHD